MPPSLTRATLVVASILTLCACKGGTTTAEPPRREQPASLPPTGTPPSVAASPSSSVPTAAPSVLISAPAPASAPWPTATANGAGPFHFDRVHESCNSFSAHITNAAKTAWLDVRVAVDTLKLGPGEHSLPIDGKAVTLQITELPRRHDGEWSCTDVGGGPLTKVKSRWVARKGDMVRVRLHLPLTNTKEQPYDGPYDRADVKLEEVHFVADDGRTRSVSLQFEGMQIGWMPG